MRFDVSSLEKGIEALSKNSDIKIRMFCETGAQKMEDYAKKNAPWKNHTWRARRGLSGYVEPKIGGYRIAIAHGVSYGVDLEFKYEKKYAIIPDTIKYGQAIILPAFNRLLHKV